MKKVSVQCRGIGLSYGSTEVLKGVNLDIQPGEFFALLGPSGSGKSTVLRLLAGFARHQRGELLIDGVDVSARAPWQRQVGLVFQNYALWPHMSVWDNVAFGLVERREPAAVIRQKVGAALDLVGLADYGQRRPNQLSGGQQQRVALARTLVIEPQVLLLDEPLSNLDKTLRVQMRQELLAMQRRLGLTTIFVTHDQEEAMTTADRMAVLDQGVVQQVGTPRALYDEPVNAFVANFVGTNNLLDVQLRPDDQGGPACIEWPGVGTWPWTGPVPPGAPSRCVLSFRPHAITLQPTPSPDLPPSCIQADAVVEAHEFCGETTRYRLRVGDQEVLADRAHRSGLAPWTPGTRLTLQVDLSQTRLLA